MSNLNICAVIKEERPNPATVTPVASPLTS